MIPYVRLIWSNFCIYVENEHNNTKTLTAESPYIGVKFINIETYPGWQELPLTGTNFHGTEPVRATEVLL